jgi:hypothetical protein
MIRYIAGALLVTAVAAAACAPQSISGIHVQSRQMKLLPPLPPNCPMQMVSVGVAEMMPNADFGPGGKYEMVGMITVEAPAGTDPMSPELRDQVRPEACKLGGAVVSLLANGTDAFQLRRSLVTTTQQTLAFSVWGPRSAAPAKPVAF